MMVATMVKSFQTNTLNIPCALSINAFQSIKSIWLKQFFLCVHSPLLNYISLVPRLVSKFIIYFWNSFCYLCKLSFFFLLLQTLMQYNNVIIKQKPISITKCLLNTHNIIVQFCSEIIQINTQLSRANISTCQQHIYLLAWLRIAGIKNDNKKETEMYVEKYTTLDITK